RTFTYRFTLWTPRASLFLAAFLASRSLGLDVDTPEHAGPGESDDGDIRVDDLVRAVQVGSSENRRRVVDHSDTVRERDVHAPQNHRELNRHLLLTEYGLAQIEFDTTAEYGHVGAGLDEPASLAFTTAEHGDEVLRTLALLGETPSLVREDLHAGWFLEVRPRGEPLAGGGKILGDGFQLAHGFGLVEGVDAFLVLHRGETALGQRFPEPLGHLVPIRIGGSDVLRLHDDGSPCSIH